MLKQEFIDALYESGWDSPSDAQHSKIAKLHAKIFPTVARLEKDQADILAAGHFAGQSYAGIGASWEPALEHAKKFA